MMARSWARWLQQAARFVVAASSPTGFLGLLLCSNNHVAAFCQVAQMLTEAVGPARSSR